jgi:Skp family chaperone for outer membrane proteins
MMKKFWLASLVLIFTACGSAFAQGGGAPGTQSAVSKIAVIFSADFQDAKTGILRFSATITKLNAEFQPLQNELNQTAQRIKTLQDEIVRMQGGTPPSTPAQIQAKMDQLDQIKKDFQRKGEDAEANYKRRRNELLAPLQDDVSKALDAFGKTRGITMILDGSQIPLVYAADSLDVTKAFIADYNSKNPATAATATPR